MSSRWLALGALLAAMGVAAGAFGAHGLKHHLSPDRLAIYETAARYHQWTSLGLMLAARSPGRALLLAGGVIFCGSLYLLSLTGHRWLVASGLGRFQGASGYLMRDFPSGSSTSVVAVIRSTSRHSSLLPFSS
ncbi:DUF423 domain-containing protein [bacterium CPR1]|nr:DUF423 domain-containing protein [bacterium CPR1]